MFKKFPEFSRLTLADKEAYEALIRSYPAISEISFPTVITWWNVLGTAAIARLNGNIVVSYWLPGDEDNTGLSIIGTHKIDESICHIFDYLHENNQTAKLVHVSEFVVNSVRYPHLFKFQGERDFDEYILSVKDVYPLSNTTEMLRTKIERFFTQTRGNAITSESLDLNLWKNRQLLLKLSKEWSEFSKTPYPSMVQESRREILKNADILGMENICVYIGGRMYAFFLYRIQHDKTWAISSYLDFDTSIPGMNEFLMHTCAKYLQEKGIQFINIDCDLGDHTFRRYELPLGPTNFFRKYTITPA